MTVRYETCCNCGWTGKEKDLLPDETGFPTYCPVCKSEHCLMDEDKEE